MKCKTRLTGRAAGDPLCEGMRAALSKDVEKRQHLGILFSKPLPGSFH